MQNKFDTIIVGSGINSLVCAAIASKKGKRILLLEREDEFGGCIKSGEITSAGYTHDLLSSWHPLFVTSAGYGELADDLAKHGLEYVNTKLPTACIDSKQRALIFTTDRDENTKHLNDIFAGAGDEYKNSMRYIEKYAELIFYFFGNHLWSFATVKFLAKYIWKNGLLDFIGFIKDSLQSSQSWIEGGVKSQTVGNLFAPWVLHTGLAPNDNMSALMAKLIFFTLEQAGMPVVKGGSANLVKALIAIIEKNNGKCITKSDVNQLLIDNNTVNGVGLKNGNVYYANNVVCNVSPEQLTTRLLRDDDKLIADDSIKKYRYGRGAMQIHVSLKSKPKWVDERLNDVAIVHLSDDVYGINQACNEAKSGLLPQNATIVVGQPCVVDETRAPKDCAIFWIQLQELPNPVRGDAQQGKDAIKAADGKWSEQLKQDYCARIFSRLRKHVVNFDDIVDKTVIYSPDDLAKMNINLVGGDPYCGDCALDQFFIFRPSFNYKNNKTKIKNLYHIGAATHPGPGLAGNSGYLVAKKYL